MPRKRVRLDKRTHRAVLSDVLPFEVPPTFSNRHYYKFLSDNEVEVVGTSIAWKAGAPALDVVMRLILGVKAGTQLQTSVVVQWGRTKTTHSVPVKECRLDTIPMCFRVSHKSGEARTLSVVHPRNQIMVSDFYRKFGPSIIYYCSISEFSIRRPVGVSNITYFSDRTHQFRLDNVDKGVEQDGLEYEQMSSYFVYRRYSNIHRFFESYQYHRSEKRYNAMLKIDVTKCFDSIYSHSVVWAVLGKSQTKFHLSESAGTFAGKFDRLMQLLNQRETNGIVIGPEFSRIFAEIIMQAVDRAVESRMSEHKLIHKRDYEVFRYVDDYFVFFNEESTSVRFLEVLREELLEYKLNVNPSKTVTYQKPIITEITVAKDRISDLLNSEIRNCFDQCVSSEDSVQSQARRLGSCVDPNRLIIRFKTILLESGVSYSDVLNYTLAVIENKTFQIMRGYAAGDAGYDRKRLVIRSIKDLMEFVFFIYAASPKVNHTVRMVRLIANVVDFLNERRFDFELKHLVYKYVHDNLAQQLDKYKMDPFREVETLYLLNGLAHLGREYWLPEASLAAYLRLEKDQNGDFKRAGFLSHFAITVALSYMRGKLIYTGVRSFIEAHAVEKLAYMKAHCPNDGESLMLLLDLIVCPHISQTTQEALISVFGYQPQDLPGLKSVSSQWFTTWESFDLAKELDAKRSREVY